MHPEFKDKNMLDFVFRKGEAVEVRRQSARDQLQKQDMECTDDIVEDLMRKVEIHRGVDESEYAEAFGYQQTVFRQQLTRIAVIPLNEVLDEEPSLKLFVEEWAAKMV